MGDGTIAAELTEWGGRDQWWQRSAVVLHVPDFYILHARLVSYACSRRWRRRRDRDRHPCVCIHVIGTGMKCLHVLLPVVLAGGGYRSLPQKNPQQVSHVTADVPVLVRFHWN